MTPTTPSRRASVIGALGVIAVTMSIAAGCTTDSPSSGVVLGVALDVGTTGTGTVNGLAKGGADEAHEDLDINVRVHDVTDVDARPIVIGGLVDEGANPVVVIGGGAAADLADIAALHPNTSFVLVGGTFAGVLESTPPNVRTVTFAEHEGAFLMGAAAALSCGCERLGFIGGQENEGTRRYEAGFVAGAQHVVANIPVDVRYLGAETDPMALASPDAAEALAAEMYANGVGAIFTVAGGSDAGVFAAAAAADRWALATGADVADSLDDDTADHVLTSLVLHVDRAVYDAARDFLDGQFTGGDVVADVASGWLTWSTSGGHVDQISEQLAQVQSLIATGAITVPTTP